MNFGQEKYIRRDRPYPKTKLALRLTPIQDEQDLTTLQFKGLHIPITAMKIRASIPTGKGLMEEDNAEPLSYLPGDLVYSWKDPKYWKSLKGVDVDHNTVEEAVFCDDEDGEENQIYVWSTFNLLEKKQFYDFEKNKWIIRNSDDLEAAIDVPGVLINMKEIIFSKDDLLGSLEDKRKMVKVTDGGFSKDVNLAHEGIIVKDDLLVAGKKQDLFFYDELEWYVPYFNNEIPGQGLLELQTDNTLKMNDAWVKAYMNCLPEDYRGDRRFTILYRRYDPSKETKLEEEYSDKFLLLDRIFSELITNENIRTYVTDSFKSGKTQAVIAYSFLNYYLIFKPKDCNVEEYTSIIKKFYQEYYQIEEKRKNPHHYEQFISNIMKLHSDIKVYVDDQGTISDEGMLGIVKTSLKDKIKDLKETKLIKSSIDDMDIGMGSILLQSIIKNSTPILYFYAFSYAYHTVAKKLLAEKNLKLHKLRRTIFARALKGGKYKEHFQKYLFFKEPNK